jgi:hypothetical protein
MQACMQYENIFVCNIDIYSNNTRLPELIEAKWPSSSKFQKEFSKTIEFKMPINPAESGLLDVDSEVLNDMILCE